MSSSSTTWINILFHTKKRWQSWPLYWPDPTPPPNLGSEHFNSTRTSPSFPNFQPLISYNLILEAKGNMTQCSVQSILKWTRKIKTVSQLTRKIYFFPSQACFLPITCWSHLKLGSNTQIKFWQTFKFRSNFDILTVLDSQDNKTQFIGRCLRYICPTI